MKQAQEWTDQVLRLLKRVGWVLFLLPGQLIAWWEYPSRRDRQIGPARRRDPQVTHFVVTTLLYAFGLFLYAVLAPHGGVAPHRPATRPTEPVQRQEARPPVASAPKSPNQPKGPVRQERTVAAGGTARSTPPAAPAPPARPEPEKPSGRPAPSPANLAKVIDPSDWRHVRRALEAASRSGGTAPRPWRNPANGHRGFVTDTGLSPDAHGCRQFRVTRNKGSDVAIGFVDKCGNRIRP